MEKGVKKTEMKKNDLRAASAGHAEVGNHESEIAPVSVAGLLQRPGWRGREGWGALVLG